MVALTHRSGVPTLSAEQLIRAYGKVLIDHSAELVRDSRVLPGTAEEIGIALLAAIANTDDMLMKEKLRTGFLELASFLNLSENEKKAIGGAGGLLSVSSDSDPLALASAIANSSDNHLELQDRVLQKQAALMEVLKNFEGKVRKEGAKH